MSRRALKHPACVHEAMAHYRNACRHKGVSPVDEAAMQRRAERAQMPLVDYVLKVSRIMLRADKS